MGRAASLESIVRKRDIQGLSMTLAEDRVSPFKISLDMTLILSLLAPSL